MRLLITGLNWPPETFLRRLIDGLINEGVEVTVGSAQNPDEPQFTWLPTPSWDAPLPARLARLFWMMMRAQVAARSDLKLLKAHVEKVPGAAARLRAWNQLLPYAGRHWDIIYFPWNSVAVSHLPIYDLPSPILLSCRGTQVSVAPHNPGRAEFGLGLRGTFQCAAAVHCVSEATLKDACQLGLDPAKVRVIRPAVDPEQFRPASSRPNANDDLRVVTVGRLIWVKGHEWALQAIRTVADQGVNVRFQIIGDGPDRQRVLYTIADLGLEDRVQWLGKLPPPEVLAQVQQADAFLLSSLSEGISNAVLEAMACGLPVVTTDCGGMREAVTDGVEGFVVPVRDAQAMSAALLKLAADPGLRQRMGHAARARIVRDFVLKRQVEQWLALFQSVLGRQTSVDMIPLSVNQAEVEPASSPVVQ